MKQSTYTVSELSKGDLTWLVVTRDGKRIYHCIHQHQADKWISDDKKSRSGNPVR